MGEGVKNCPKLRHLWTNPYCILHFFLEHDMKGDSFNQLCYSEYDQTKFFKDRTTSSLCNREEIGYLMGAVQHLKIFPQFVLSLTFLGTVKAA